MASRAVNAIVSRLLRSRLHPIISGSVTLLTYRGRRTGQPHSLPVQYATFDEKMVIVPGRAETKRWWRNFQDGDRPVELLVKGVRIEGRAHVLATADPVRGLAISAYQDRFPRASLTDESVVLVVDRAVP